jgi:hypothetical protein
MEFDIGGKLGLMIATTGIFVLVLSYIRRKN